LTANGRALAGRGRLRERALRREDLVGCQVGGDSSWLVEMAALAGYDYATLDLEHEAIGEAEAAAFARTCDAAGIGSVIRVPVSHRMEAVLNTGVSGVMAPNVNTPQAARELVELTRYHPLGRRGYSSSVRSVDYGMGGDPQAALRKANEQLLVIAMIEDHRSLDVLDEILDVPGIDAIRVGPGDLAQSMGFPEKAEVATIADQIIRRVVARGKIAGLGSYVGAGAPGEALEEVARHKNLGATLHHVALTRVIGRHLTHLRHDLDGALTT
jgi:4-hydroxy-2-oxoheptanedioate aldolase